LDYISENSVYLKVLNYFNATLVRKFSFIMSIDIFYATLVSDGESI